MDSEGISFMTFQVSLSHIFRMRSTFPHDVFPLKQNVRGYTSVLYIMYTVSTRDGGKILKRFRPQSSSDAPSRLGGGRRASNLGRPRPYFLLHFPQSATVCWYRRVRRVLTWYSDRPPSRVCRTPRIVGHWPPSRIEE